MIRLWGTALAAAALAACVPRTMAPAPRPAPPPAPAPPPPAAPPPAPAPPVAWQDGPLSPGDWTYERRGDPRAAFGAPDPVFVVGCTAARQVSLARVDGAGGQTLAIRTTFGERSFPVAQPSATIVVLAASDPLLDEMAFSRGRFLVRTGGQPDLILPTWPELARVVEDCRGQ
jgi:hypothetical protein